MYGSVPFKVVGYKKNVKDGKVFCNLAFIAHHNDYNADFIGDEASTCKIDNAEMFDAVISYPLGTTLYGVLTRSNYRLQLIGFDNEETERHLKKGEK